MSAIPIDWISIFEEHGIEYRTRGANVAHGNINIHCPWCAYQDPSYHLGVSLTGKGYGCWRNSRHRGKDPSWLIRSLLGHQVAAKILARYVRAGRAHGRPEIVRDEIIRPHVLHLPEGVVQHDPIVDSRWDAYLVSRGFGIKDLPALWNDWGLLVGKYGTYAGRVLIPYYVRGEAVFFTARAITKDAEIRYKAMPHDQAVIDPKTILFNHDAIASPGGIILCEGPLDAIKATMYGPLPAVALSSNHATQEQLLALRAASRIYILLDNDHDDVMAVGEQALLLYYELIRLGIPCVTRVIPKGYKDLAEIPAEKFADTITLEYLTCR